MNMKVTIELLEAGIYKDRCWQPAFKADKSQVCRVSPSYAAHLIKEKKAVLHSITK